MRTQHIIGIKIEERMTKGDDKIALRRKTFEKIANKSRIPAFYALVFLLSSDFTPKCNAF